ncbi:MAG: hypothetical protein QXM31_00920 [Candidatus Woesearchaeota archaeon]
MDKRGQAAEQVLDADKLLIAVFISLIIVAMGYGIYEIFWKEKPSDIVRDRDRVVAELMNLQPDEKLQVITAAKSRFLIQMFGTGNSQKECSMMPCVCVVDNTEVKCAQMPKITNDCASGICAPKGESLGKEYAGAGTAVTICRKANELHIGDACS